MSKTAKIDSFFGKQLKKEESVKPTAPVVLESTPPSIPPLSTDRTTFVKTTQNTQGNMYFTSTLKIQIIKKSSPQLLETPMIPLPPFPSKASGVISFGDKYGKI